MGGGQVGGGFEALAFDNFWLQVEENQVLSRPGCGLDIVAVASHCGSLASREQRVSSSHWERRLQ